MHTFNASWLTKTHSNNQTNCKTNYRGEFYFHCIAWFFCSCSPKWQRYSHSRQHSSYILIILVLHIVHPESLFPPLLLMPSNFYPQRESQLFRVIWQNSNWILFYTDFCLKGTLRKHFCLVWGKFLARGNVFLNFCVLSSALWPSIIKMSPQFLSWWQCSNKQ